jgi:hypothetical protein
MPFEEFDIFPQSLLCIRNGKEDHAVDCGGDWNVLSRRIRLEFLVNLRVFEPEQPTIGLMRGEKKKKKKVSGDITQFGRRMHVVKYDDFLGTKELLGDDETPDGLDTVGTPGSAGGRYDNS